MTEKKTSGSHFRELPPHVRHDPDVIHWRIDDLHDQVTEIRAEVTELKDQETINPVKYLLKRVPWPVLAFFLGLFASLRPKEFEQLLLRLLGAG